MSGRVAELNCLVEGARIQRSGGPNGAIHVAWLRRKNPREFARNNQPWSQPLPWFWGEWGRQKLYKKAWKQINKFHDFF